MEQATTTPSVWDVLESDEEIVADLQNLGLLVGTTYPRDQARRDALASILLRRQAEELEAIASAERSRELEVQFIASRYAPELARRRTRVTQIDAAIKAVASETKDAGGYIGRKKSRDVGAGSYGYRTNAAYVELRQEAEYIAWAEQHAPETLRVKPTLTLAQAKEFLSETELANVRREIIKADATKLAEVAETLPAGFTKVEESHDFYAKPLPAAAIAGARV